MGIRIKICLAIIGLFISLASLAQNCKELPNTFTSIEQATKLVKNSRFSYTDHVITQKSSWIQKGSYYSCDGKTGFFVLLTKSGKEYLFQELPIDTWKGFKTAQSHGQFYDQNIRNHYQLKIKKL